MYYPILRGKQNELLALRECRDVLASSPMLPVVEPVRDLTTNGGTLRRCLEALHEAEAPVAVVINPCVGEYAGRADASTSILQVLDDVDPDGRTIRTAIVVGGAVTPHLLSRETAQRTPRPHVYLHGLTSVTSTDDLEPLIATSMDVTHIAEERSRVRRHPSFARNGDRVAKLSDEFARASSNSEYPDCVPYQFTDWNLFYADDGYVGYSDFAMIGREYSTSGFTPRSVAIHLTYSNRTDSTIWIQHFVSTRGRDSVANVAAKFDEAVTKLVEFADREGLENPAVDQFRQLHRAGQFPGLGVIKKLSLINHLHVAGSANG